MKKNTANIAKGGVIAAAYILLTLLSAALGLSSGVIQVRISEALCILPCYTGAAIPGLFIGCILANLLTGANVIDIIFGSLATLIGAAGTYIMRKHRYAAVLPPIVANTIIIPLIFTYAYEIAGSYLYFALTVFIGELISCGILGELLYSLLAKRKDLF